MRLNGLKTFPYVTWDDYYKFPYWNYYEKKTIKQVCKPNSLPYISIADAIAIAKKEIEEFSKNKPSFRITSVPWEYRSITNYIGNHYKGVLCSDGFWFVPYGSTFSKPGKYIPKTTKEYPVEEVLSYDFTNQPIHAGDILFYSRGRGTYNDAMVCKVISITDGKGSLIVHQFDKKNNDFENKEIRINYFKESAVLLTKEAFECYTKK